MTKKTHRIDLTDAELTELQNALSSVINSDQTTAYETMLKKVQKPKEIIVSQKKQNATKKAHQKKINSSLEKIQNGINLCTIQNQKFTLYSLAKISGVSYPTVKKYKDVFLENPLFLRTKNYYLVKVEKDYIQDNDEELTDKPTQLLCEIYSDNENHKDRIYEYFSKRKVTAIKELKQEDYDDLAKYLSKFELSKIKFT